MIDWNRWQNYQQAMSPLSWAIVGLVVLGSIWLIVWIRSYFRDDADNADETLEMLTQFRELHQEGGLSDDEFRLIRSRLALTAKQALQARHEPSAVPAETGLPGFLETKLDIPLDAPESTAIVKPEDAPSEMMDKEAQ
ncbi:MULTISPECIES: hypothetical protein [unclassified Schlesneria]|uniref:hypothetical protein n=1 Tax=Schlesneria TaxID=656899 RepID=UPI002EEDD5CF